MNVSKPVAAWRALTKCVPLALALAGPINAETLATIDGQKVSRHEVEQRVAAELQDLELKRHQLIDAALRALVDEKLLTKAAAEADVSIAELLGEESIPAVTDAEVDSWYEANKARVRQSKDAVAEQIKAFLSQERHQAVRQKALEELRGHHEIDILLDPLRVELGSAPAAARGSLAPEVTLTVFSDFQCPYCKQILPELANLEQRYPDTLRVVFRHYPLSSIHPRASAASEAAICAEEQGSFWQMHDGIFASQKDLGDQKLRSIATEVGLDAEIFDACVAAESTAERLATDLDIGRRAGVSSTPSLFVNGRPVALLRGRAPSDIIAELVDEELNRSKSGS